MCLRVGIRSIDAAIASGAVTVEAVGAAAGAGNNCGSCRPQIARMMADARSPTADETRAAA